MWQFQRVSQHQQTETLLVLKYFLLANLKCVKRHIFSLATLSALLFCFRFSLAIMQFSFRERQNNFVLSFCAVAWFEFNSWTRVNRARSRHMRIITGEWNQKTIVAQSGSTTFIFGNKTHSKNYRGACGKQPNCWSLQKLNLRHCGSTSRVIGVEHLQTT